MSTTPPTFENYPPAPDAAVGAFGGGDPVEAPRVQPQQVVFTPPSTPPPPPPGPDRRSVLRWIGAGAVALVALPVIASVRNGGDSGIPADGESQAADPVGNETDLNGYTVSWPDGWTLNGTTETQVVLVQGEATMIFRAYAAGDDTTAMEEAQRLLNRHTAGLGKRRTGATNKGSGSIETANIEASGVRGDGVQMEVTVHVAIESDGRNSLAVIALLPAGTSADRRAEVTRMRREFLGQLD